jgi:ELWxxDGT repeat protein
MKVIHFSIITIFVIFFESHAAFANNALVPVISLLLNESPLGINKCQANLLADLNGPQSTGHAVAARFTNLGNLTLFFADHEDTGKEPWVTDGTPAGTHILKDIQLGPEDSIETSSPDREIVRVGDKVYFLADDGVHGEELWVTDGTNNGTKMVDDIESGTGSSWLRNLTSFNGKLYFLMARPDPDGNGVNGLWVSEGTAETTQLVSYGPPNIGTWSGEKADSMVVLNNRLIFAARSEDAGFELWQSDGNSSGTSLLKDIYPGTSHSNPRQLTVVADKVFFMANDGSHGTELWVTNGTSNGTLMVKDIYPGSERGVMAISIDAQRKKNPGFNDKLYFAGRTPSQGTELWVTDGTPAGTNIVRDIAPGSDSSDLVTPHDCLRAGEVFNNKFYFSADVYSEAGDKIHDRALWRVNEDGSTTVQYSCCPPPQSNHSNGEVEFLTANNDFLFFRGTGVLNGSYRRQELFIMDNHGQTRLIDIYPGNVTSDPGYLHIRNDQSLLFVTDGNLAPGVGLYLLECQQ